MFSPARSFEERMHTSLLRGAANKSSQPASEAPPWGLVQAGAMPPMMFELRLHDGTMTSFAYSDVRMIRCPDAGRVELYLLGMGKLKVSIQGRHLRDLASSFNCCLVRWVQEGDPRDEKAEDDPYVTEIAVHDLSN